MNRLLAYLVKAKEREQGQGLVEYGLIVLLISLASIATLRSRP